MRTIILNAWLLPKLCADTDKSGYKYPKRHKNDMTVNTTTEKMWDFSKSPVNYVKITTFAFDKTDSMQLFGKTWHGSVVICADKKRFKQTEKGALVDIYVNGVDGQNLLFKNVWIPKSMVERRITGVLAKKIEDLLQNVQPAKKFDSKMNGNSNNSNNKSNNVNKKLAEWQ